MYFEQKYKVQCYYCMLNTEYVYVDVL